MQFISQGKDLELKLNIKFFKYVKHKHKIDSE